MSIKDLSDGALKWLPVLLVAVGVIAAATLVQAQVRDLSRRLDLVEPSVGGLREDVREVKTDVKWIRERLK